MKKPKVAFICVHNSCRSQIAEDWNLDDSTGRGDDFFREIISKIERNIKDLSVRIKKDEISLTKNRS